MKEILKIAWRNLWRNKRRTLITAASIFFAVFFSILMRSFQLGTYGFMIQQSIESYSGYLQIQHPEYGDEPIIENGITLTDSLWKAIESVPNVKVAVPRIETFALASTGMTSKGVLISGISPEKEKRMSNPEHTLVFEDDSTSIASQYLTENDNGILVSYRLSHYLNVLPGDTIVLIGQGYQGTSAAGVYPVRGIVKLPSLDLDNKLVYMTLNTINEFLGLSDEVTSIAINLDNPKDMTKTQQTLQAKIGNENMTVKNWETTMSTLKQQIESDDVSGQLFVAVLYVIIFFGIFGTITMMLSERMREFGVMVSIGMKRSKLALVFLMEMLLMGFIGIIAGMIATVPIILYAYYYPLKIGGAIGGAMIEMGLEPLCPFAWFDTYFYMQAIIVSLMVLLACLYPLKKLLTIDAIKAMRN
jgi:ABC-type lipoprotein release transport system permease subunit